MQFSRKAFTSILLVVVFTLSAVGTVLANSITGPSSSQSPYILRSQPGVVTKSIFTVGDSANFKADGVTPYRMVGLPDGLGAFDNGDGTFTLLANHELGATSGIARRHGGTGAFVSSWIIRKSDLGVLHGEDVADTVMLWSSATASYTQGSNVSFARFCSGDLPEVSAFFDASSGAGTTERLFMNGEESGNEGRAFAHNVD